MSKEAKKSNEAQLLELLKRVLPKATHDAQLAGKIYEAIELELKTKARAIAFEKFCGGIELPNLEQKTVADVKLQLAAVARRGWHRARQVGGGILGLQNRAETAP